ncbi:MerR family transcriptional regulator [Sphingorhabdus sp.]|jgi:DNA-binding transcriptional MerR regulator|uniref:MerR family transcriptional regulator n=1 Tax=Sphingorhabdus sp. TaxID=1902408 RepID=UPI0035B02A8B|nr:MerR family transcriptional regulator [Sphingomonadaceae bacterium]
MDKAPDAFLTIGEMAERLGVRTHILRYWEEQFPMLQPLKRAGGRRLYRPSDVALLDRIQDLLANQGYTIRGARAFLAKGGNADVAALAAAPPAPAPHTAPEPASDFFARPEPVAALPELRAIRDRLARALAAG